MISLESIHTSVKRRGTSFRWINDDSETRWLTKIVEMLVFALAVPAIGYTFFRDDPVGLHSGLPWLLLPPVVFAVRYGTVWGLLCGLTATASLLYPWQAYVDNQSQLIALAIGTIVLCIIVGDAASTWKRSVRTSAAENGYLRHRLKEFSNDYHILKVSHGQLEEFMAGRRLSLRQAMQQLKPALSTDGEGLQAGNQLMAVFAQFGAVQIAGLYGMKTESRVDPEPIAVHGEMPALPLFDPLLKLAVEHKQLVSLKLTAQAEGNHSSELLAVLPLVDSQGKLHGILAIKDMHFMAFQQENLNVLSLLGNYIGDQMTRARASRGSRSGAFLAELDSAVNFARSSNIQSSLLCLQLKPFDRADEVAEFISSNIRSLDSAWQPQSGGNQTTIVVLLPLISDRQCKAYFERIVRAVEEQFELDLNNCLDDVRVRQIQRRDSRESCLEFINALGTSEAGKGSKRGLFSWMRSRAA